jgi:hypothetical protein
MYYIKYFDMFRATLCSSSGGQNCIFTASGIVTDCEVFNVIHILQNKGIVRQADNKNR